MAEHKTNEWAALVRPQKPLWWAGAALVFFGLVRNIDLAPFDTTTGFPLFLQWFDNTWDNTFGVIPTGILVPAGIAIIVKGPAGLDMLKSKIGGIFK